MGWGVPMGRYGFVLGLMFLTLTGCGTPTRPPTDPTPPDACGTNDGALGEAAFVFATTPTVGTRVTSGFEVQGCSRTFESTANWRLVARDGRVLAEGFTRGGGVDGPGPFSFTVAYTVNTRQIGHLEVFEEDVSGGEGFPPGRTVIPLVLLP